MARLLLINRRPDERRVALIEGGVTRELFFERVTEQPLVGTIFKGKVVRVLPGMQCAFLEVGLARTAFLFVADVADRTSSLNQEDVEEPTHPGMGSSIKEFPPIDSLVRVGDELLVQVTREPIGNKGARVTRHIGLPGRCLVYTPNSDHVGVSRRISNSMERMRLKAIAAALKPEKGGVIVRTAAEGLDAEDLAEDLTLLVTLWESIDQQSRELASPSRMYGDLDLTLRSIRDLVVSDGDRVVADSMEEVDRIKAFLSRFMPEVQCEVELYDGTDPMFEQYGVAWEISRAVRRKIWLRSGGYIIIDRTEALTAIDVNSGRFVGRRDFTETVLEINLEAAQEIAYQLRLRDIGGLIVIDFIDLEEDVHRERVTDSLRKALAGDKARTYVAKMSELGLVEMTRRRARNTIVESLQQPCFYCHGTGSLKSFRVIADDIFAKLRQHLKSSKSARVRVVAHPRITELLAEERRDLLGAIEAEHDLDLVLESDPTLHMEGFRIQ
jgi:ribonuclease G